MIEQGRPSTEPATEPPDWPDGPNPEDRARLLVVFNPWSGQGGARRRLDPRKALLQALNAEPAEVILYGLEGAKSQDLEAVIVRAAKEGVRLVVAAGGDGTVAAVAECLAGSNMKLGIVPLGTANVLARAMDIPIEVEAACRLIRGPHALISIDAMQVDGRLYFTQVGVGVDSLMIRDTRMQAKKRFGRVAYVWTGLRRLLRFRPRRFLLRVDGGRSRLVRASQVVVANVAAMGMQSLTWGTRIRPDDGKLNLCIVRARTVPHYLALAWRFWMGRHDDDPHTHYLAARESIEIAMKSADRPLPVQADGEIVGETPVRIVLRPSAVQVIVPLPTPDSPASGSPCV